MRTSSVDLMRRAIRLAAHGHGSTSPNPPVGAIVVAGGEVVGEGWHRGPGSPHAEIVALEQAGERARGATLYVTLEPCSHDAAVAVNGIEVPKRTPPCAPRVIAAGITKVVVASQDPHPSEGGAGLRVLREAGVDVVSGVLESEASALIAGFTKWIQTGIPLVTVKIASSLDGRVAAADGSSRWVTGPGARRDAHRMRAQADAVLVGVGTVLADDPSLTVRLRGFKGRQPLRVVLDSSARTPVGSKTLPALLAVTSKASDANVATLVDAGAEVVFYPERDGRIDIAAVLEDLGKRGVCEVLVEGGPTVVGDLVERRLVDRYVFYLAPKLLGQVGLSAVAGIVAPNIADARELLFTSVRRVGSDIKIEARPRP